MRDEKMSVAGDSCRDKVETLVMQIAEGSVM